MLRCGIATPPKQKNCTRSTTWPTPIYRKRKTPRQTRSWISPRPCAKPIPSWNSARLMLWPPSRRVMRSSATPGPMRRRCAFRHCRTGLPFRSWKRSSNTPTPSGERIRTISRVHARRWTGCGNCAMRRRIRSLIILRDNSTSKCRPHQPGWRMAKARRRTP